MGHFEPEVYDGEYYIVDTIYGTYYVPGDFVESDDQLESFVEGRILEVRQANGVLGRLTAPGYLDSTDWTPYSSMAEAYSALEEELGE
ncbi:MAG: hypothetical protein QXT45_05915 [Candidatus Bilamarchaeaceae archaeon]